MGGRGSKNKSSIKLKISRQGWKSNPQFSENTMELRDTLGQKGAPKSIANSTLDTNPLYNRDYNEFTMNCQRCVVAYELNRRGYDVEARPTFQGDKLPSVAYYDRKNGTLEGRWKGAFRDAKSVNVGVNGNNTKAEKAVISNIENQVRNWGDGARGVIQIFYRSGGGHVFNVENQGGRVVYVEAQAGKLKNFATETIHNVDTGSVSMIRTDNLRISDRAKNFVRPKRKK